MSVAPPATMEPTPLKAKVPINEQATKKVVVLKFGSSVIRIRQDYQRVSHVIYGWVRKGYGVIAVVSAMGNTTDELFTQAYETNKHPSPEILASLVATGEGVSACHLGLALDKAGIPTRVLEPSGLGLKTRGSALDATCETLDTASLKAKLARFTVLVVPGYVGIGETGGLTLLGRGGTDLSALFIADKLGAEFCHLVKDVDGLYTDDPAEDPEAMKFKSVSYADVLALEEGIIQHKAVRYARNQGLSFEVGCLLGTQNTLVSEKEIVFEDQRKPRPKTRLILVGRAGLRAGLTQLLAEFPEEFEVVSSFENVTGLMDRSRPPQDSNVGAAVFVDLGDGSSQGESIVRQAFNAGCDVVSANTASVAEHGAFLKKRAQDSQCSYYFSAALGGSIPIVETLSRAKSSNSLREIEASWSPANNFFLQGLQQGHSLADARAQAVVHGISHSEIDNSLGGNDDLAKLRICANAGFGFDLKMDEINMENVTSWKLSWPEKRGGEEWVLRFVASIRREPGGVFASLRPRWLAKPHPLANLPIESCGFVLHLRDGSQTFLQGHGRGAHPILMAICADLWALREKHQSANKEL